MVTQEGSVFGQMPIKQLVAEKRSLFKKLSTTQSTKLFEHSDRKVLDFGKIFILNNKRVVTDSLHYVIAWRLIGDRWLREVDIILPTLDMVDENQDIAQMRSEWVKYANGDDPESMVNELFLNDAMYLNNSELSKGHPAITKRLDFIKNPAFHINLKGEDLLVVDDETVIDIGNWITNEYIGYYLIIWEKDESGDWKISLYFNF